MARIDFFGDGGGFGDDVIDVVRDHGADASGLTDSGPAQRAAWLAGVAQGKPVYYPPGNYGLVLTTNAEPLLPASGLRVFGHGEKSRIFRLSGDLPMIQMRPTDGALDGFHMQDLYFDYMGQAMMTGSGLCLKFHPSAGTRIVLEAITVRNVPEPSPILGVGAVGINDFTDVTIRQCLFEDCDRDFIDVLRSEKVLIEGNWLRRNGECQGHGTNAKDGSGFGDDNISLVDSSQVLVTGNVFDSPEQGKGRVVWLASTTDTGDIAVVGNYIRGGWRQAIAVEAYYDSQMSDVTIVGNVFDRIGAWSTSAIWGDAIRVGALVGVSPPMGYVPGIVRRVVVADNVFKSPHKHAVGLLGSEAGALIADVRVADNTLEIDRALTDMTETGCFVHCDAVTDPLQLDDLHVSGNHSEGCWAEAVSLTGDTINRPRIEHEVHKDAGTAAAPVVTYYFDEVAELVLDSCGAHDFSGEARTTDGANFINLVTSARIVDNTFVDTTSGDVQVTGAAPALYLNRDNWGDATLWP